ncbi:MAG: 2-oxoglutarate oxidoreductase [Spirochaetales bacterium]|nr:2-oxoglutarate oxidoreductase [Spirochaetales bacterium]
MVIEKIVYKKPESLTDCNFTFCSGCGHSTVHKLIAEIIDELDLREKTIAVAPVGCAVFAYDFWNFDIAEAPHGRTPIVASGIKRIHPEAFVLCYQGDGDLVSIGLSEIMHTANRGENISVIFINNTNYGMTGGQMAPTTLVNQVTMTSPRGRDIETYGHPIKMSELLVPLEGVKYLERAKITTPASILKAKKAIKKAFLNQINGVGFSMVEILTACPESWKKSPKEAVAWVEDVVSKFYPVGKIKDIT